MNNKIKTAVASLLAIGLSGALLFTSSTASAQSADEIMKKSHLTYYYSADDGTAEVNMVITNKSGKTRSRTFTMLRKDFTEGGEQRYYTYFKEPR